MSVGKGWDGISFLSTSPTPTIRTFQLKGLKSCPKVGKIRVISGDLILRNPSVRYLKTDAPQTWSHLSNSSPLMKSCKVAAPTCLKPSNFLLLDLMLKIISKQKYTHTHELVKWE